MAGTSPEWGLPTPAPANTHGPASILLPPFSWLPAEVYIRNLRNAEAGGIGMVWFWEDFCICARPGSCTSPL